MMRLSLIIALLTAALIVAWTQNVWLTAGGFIAGFFLNILVWKNVGKAMRALAPVAVFAAALALLQWFYDGFHPAVAAKTVAVFWLTASAFRLTPWNHLADAIRPASRSFALTLYLLFIRHFALILAGEFKRVFTARSCAVPRPYGRWFFRSLAAALVSLFLRAITRAERFYAAQILKGF
jgi:hypothetical protein